MNVLEAVKAMNGTIKEILKDTFSYVSTDTRDMKKDSIYFAIKGENFDGADYIEDAFKKGASCVVTTRKITRAGVIVVDDVIKALGRLAKYHRNKFNIPIIAVTGSVGKTTVKNMIVSVLGQKYNVHSTLGNKNNHIGLPLTLLNLKNEHHVSVLEMGMNSLGEIDYLSSLAMPDYAVITNIGNAHIGKLGNKENILKAKMEVLNYMKENSVVVLNGDDDMLSKLYYEKFKFIRFGENKNLDYVVSDIKSDFNGKCIFKALGTEFELPVIGRHNAINAMPAIAIGIEMGLTKEEIKTGLKCFTQSSMRTHRFIFEGVNYINDAYNANTDSMKAALEILKNSPKRRIAVLGDMLEMGNFSKKEHENLGEFASKCADYLLLCGNEAENIKNGACKYMCKKNIKTFKSSKEAMPFLKNMVKTGDTVLVKGSRGMKMETVLEYTEDRRNK